MSGRYDDAAVAGLVEAAKNAVPMMRMAWNQYGVGGMFECMDALRSALTPFTHPAPGEANGATPPATASAPTAMPPEGTRCQHLETDKEYLCLDYWYVSLRKWMVSHGLVQQQDRQEVDVLVQSREVESHPRDCACATAGGSSQESRAGNAANVRDRCGVHDGGAKTTATVAGVETAEAVAGRMDAVMRCDRSALREAVEQTISARDAAWQAKCDEAKQARVYYQSIVYDVCNWIDGKLGNHITKGTGIVCGTSKEPNRNVQESLRQIGEIIAAKDAEIERLTNENERWREIQHDELAETLKLMEALGVTKEVESGAACMDAMLAKIEAMKARLTAAEAERDAARSACRAALSHMAVAHPNGHQDLKDILRAALKEKP